MTQTIIEIKESIVRQQRHLLSLPTSTRQNAGRARNLDMVLDLLDANEGLFSTLNVTPASAKSYTCNLGVLLEPFIRYAISGEKTPNKVMNTVTIDGEELYCDGTTKNGTPFECKSLVINESAEIRYENIDVYVLVLRAKCKGIFKISAKTIKENGLQGVKLGSTEVIRYGVPALTITKKAKVSKVR